MKGEEAAAWACVERGKERGILAWEGSVPGSHEGEGVATPGPHPTHREADHTTKRTNGTKECRTKK